MKVRSNVVEISVPANWSEEDCKAVLDRVARFVSKGQREATPKSDGYRFSLDDANNWWGDYDLSKHVVTVVFRYGHGFEKELTALGIVILFLFGIERENADVPAV